MPEIFSPEGLLILIRVLVAHFVADFLLQPNKWIIDRSIKKIRSGYLYLHALIVGILTYVFLADWTHVGLPLFIMATHLIIDIWKSYQKDTALYFTLDQLLHLLMILGAWVVYLQVETAVPIVLTDLFNNFTLWTLAMAYIFIIWPTGYFVAKATAHWRQEIEDIDKNELAGLSYAGKWIGRIERVLILTFVIFNYYEAIGFLIAAKSIFRVNGIKEKNDRKEVEYILIGTLLSFAMAIVTGLIIRKLLY
ncbi:DUF3307 domain-containing protein [soil metagenome]